MVLPEVAKWQAARAKGIGASDAAVVLGLSPWKSPMELWAEKTGKVEPDDLTNNEAVLWGKKLEQIILDHLADVTGRQILHHPQTEVVVHPENSWMRCTPDCWQVDEEKGEGLIEAKTCNFFGGADWSDEPPLHYQVQLQHQLAVTGEKWGTLCVLIGGQRFEYFDCERNEAFIDALIAAEYAFWQSVETDTPPSVDGTESCAKAIRAMYPTDNGEIVQLPADSEAWDARLQEIKSEMKRLETQRRELEAKIKMEIGEATIGQLPSGTEYSYRLQQRAEHVVKASEFRILRRKAGKKK
jgi:putative phage-type endonuclease